MWWHTRRNQDFVFRAKRKSPFKSARRGASVQSTTGSRGVRISGSNAGYTMFRGSVKGTGYPHHSPVSPFNSPPVRHRVPSHFNWNLPVYNIDLHNFKSFFSPNISRRKKKTNVIRLLSRIMPLVILISINTDINVGYDYCCSNNSGCLHRIAVDASFIGTVLWNKF